MRRVSHFLEELQRTRIGILIDDLSSTRSALLTPADDVTPETINRVLSLSGGLTFVAITPERAAALMIPTMPRTAASTPSPHSTQQRAQLVSVEAREGVSTGISAADRAKTLQAIGARSIQPRALVKPGHIFPVEAREGGVLVRAAIPEGALDIVRLAGHTDAALFVDLLNDRGDLMGEEETVALAQKADLPILPLSSLISYRLQRETIVTRVAESTLPTTLAGDVRVIVYRSKIGDLEHFALVKGDVAGDEPVLTRVQAEQIVSDIFGGGSPASRAHLQNSLRAIEAKQRGVVVYLRRANGEPKPQIDSYRAESSHTPTATLMREYGVGAQILRDLGATKVELITSTPRLLEGLQNFGITVVAQHPIPELVPQKGHTV